MEQDHTEWREGVIAKERVQEPALQCQECGRKFYTVRAARKAMFGDDGCPCCGGSDLDIYVSDEDSRVRFGKQWENEVDVS